MTRPHVWFQPLTGIRQLGLKRTQNGTTTYLFCAEVNAHLPLVKITMVVTPDQALTITAVFDATLRLTQEQEGESA